MAEKVETGVQPVEQWSFVSSRLARVILVALIVTMAASAYLGRAPVVTGTVKPGEFCDNDMHRMVSARVHEGESYYDALGAELRRGGYATKPLFHWRLPTLFWLMGKLPTPAIGKGLLAVLSAVMIVVWANRIRPRLGFALTCLAALLLTPALVLAVLSGWCFQHEVWTGILIALSLGLYDRHVSASVLCGLAALALRELALAYVVIMCLMAIREHRLKEAAAWALGIAAFVVYLCIHMSIVAAHQLPTDSSDPSWLRLAGWPFVVASSGWMLLSLVPYWLSGLLSVLAVFGLVALGNTRLTATVLTYMVAFCIVGKPFNDYWGLVYTPLLAIGLAHAIPAVVNLVRRAAAPCVRPAPTSQL